MAGAADLQHIAVARSVLQPRPAVGTLCRLVSAVLEHGQVGRSYLQHLAVARSVLQDLQLEPCAAGQPLASELGWFDQCSWLLSTPRLAVWTLDLQCCNLAR